MKNPKECVCIQQKQTFFILNELTKPECKDGSEPLLFHHDTFSRFNFVLINEEKKAATANINVKEIPGIFRRIRNLELKEMLSSGKEKGGNSQKPCLYDCHYKRKTKRQDSRCTFTGRCTEEPRNAHQSEELAGKQPDQISKE